MFNLFGQHRKDSSLSRGQQVEAFRLAHPHVSVSRENATDPPSVFDFGLRLPTGVVIVVRTALPEGFPDTAPIVSIVDRVTTHSWLDSATQRVVRAPALTSWSREKSNLGVAIQSIMDQFRSQAPVFVPAVVPPQSVPLRGRLLPVPPRMATPSPPSPPSVVPTALSAAPAPTPSLSSVVKLADVLGAAAVAGRRPAELPQLPKSFSQLQALTAAQLRRLISRSGVNGGSYAASANASCAGEEEAAGSALRRGIVAAADEYRGYDSYAASQREAAATAAAEAAAAAADLATAAQELRASYETARARAAEVVAVGARAAAAAECTAPAALVRELETTAAQLHGASEELADQFLAGLAEDPPPPDKEGSGGGAAAAVIGGIGITGGGMTEPSAGAGAGVTSATEARLRRFADEYLALRKRYHRVRAASAVLSAGGFAVGAG